MMLYKLLSRLCLESVRNEVISLTNNGPVGKRIGELGIEVGALHMYRRLPSPLKLIRLAGMVRQARPDLVHCWMYHANLLGGLVSRLAGGAPVIWGIRHGDLDPRLSKRSTILVARIGARLSRRLPAGIVYCAEAGRRVHEALGYSPEKMVVIPNGLDLDHFRPDPEARLAVRHELGISENAPLVGLVGRFDPQKDHRTFVAAAAKLHERNAESHFILCGDRIDRENRELWRWIGAAGIETRCRLLGPREDIARLTAALDIAVSSSAYGEGFPTVIGEAMACGVPCVVTDVGDSKLIVNGTGRIVAPKDWQALADALFDMIEMGAEGRAKLGEAARRRIQENYSLPVIAARYRAFYDEILSG